MNVTYTQSFTVHDPKALVCATRAHPDANGLPTEDFYLDDAGVDVGFCIAMLMDPGSLPGCITHNHEINQE